MKFTPGKPTSSLLVEYTILEVKGVEFLSNLTEGVIVARPNMWCPLKRTLCARGLNDKQHRNYFTWYRVLQ